MCPCRSSPPLPDQPAPAPTRTLPPPTEIAIAFDPPCYLSTGGASTPARSAGNRAGRLRFMRTSHMRLFAFFLVAVVAFAATPGDTAWQILENRIHDTNPIKRKQAVLAMGVLRPEPRPDGLLESAVDDKDASVREAACATLGVIESRASAPKLRGALSDSVPEVIFAAAKALYSLGDPAGREVLTAVLLGEQSDASGFVSGSIRSMKLKLHDPKGLLLVVVSQGAGLAGPFGMGVALAVGLMRGKATSAKTAATVLLAS